MPKQPVRLLYAQRRLQQQPEKYVNRSMNRPKAQTVNGGQYIISV